MAHYVYENQHFELPDGLSNDEAIAKIETHLGKKPKVDTRTRGPQYESYLKGVKERQSRVSIPGAEAYDQAPAMSYEDFEKMKDRELRHKIGGAAEAVGHTLLGLPVTGVAAVMGATAPINPFADTKDPQQMFENVSALQGKIPRLSDYTDEYLRSAGSILQALPPYGAYVAGPAMRAPKVVKPPKDFTALVEADQPKAPEVPLEPKKSEAMTPSQLKQWKETQEKFDAYKRGELPEQKQAAAQAAIEARQRALEEQVRRQATLDFNAAERARQERAPTGYPEHQANQAIAEAQQTHDFVSQLKQDEIDATPYGERPAQYGFTDEGGRVDENGIPIRADLSMEAQNLQDPLQRNLWGDELAPKSEQEAPLGITQALDIMPDTPFKGDARDQAVGMLSGIGRGQKGAVDFQSIIEAFPEFGNTKIRSPLYHGTTQTIDGGLKAGKDGGALGNGIYLAVRPEYASGYAEGRGGNVHQVYANIQNPLVIDGPGDPMVNALVTLGKTRDQANKIVEKAYDEKGYITTEVQNLAKKQGYDGIFQKRNGQLSEIVAFRPDQIKSAISPSYKKGQRGAIDIQSVLDGLDKLKSGLIRPQEYLKRFEGAFDAELQHDMSWKFALEESRDPKSRSRVVLMSPDDFHRLADERDPGYKLSREAEEKRMSIREGLSSQDGLFSMPLLRVDSGQVYGHEGRHRADVFKEQGIDQIPVIIRDVTTRNESGPLPYKFLIGQNGGRSARHHVSMDRITDIFNSSEPGLNSGMSRGQRGALNMGPRKQLPSADELTLLPKGARPPLADSVETPRSPETIAQRNDLGEKAAAVKLADSPYTRVTTPEQVVASLQEAPGSVADIRPSYTGIRNKNISGVESLLRLYPNNKYLNFIRSSFQEARNFHETLSKEYLTGKDGINSLLNKLKQEEKNDVVGLLLALDKKQQPLTDSIMAAAEFTDGQKAVATRIRDAMDRLYAEKSGALMEQGFAPHMERKGYVPANFSGAFKTLVGHTTKDGKFIITGIAQADTRYGHKKAVEYYKGLNDKKFSEFIPMDREGFRTSTFAGKNADAWVTLVNQLAKHDPEFAQVKALADQKGTEAVHELYKYHLHEKKKTGVTGSLGDRPWLDKDTNTKQFLEGLVDYLEDGFRYTAYQKPLNEANKLISNPKIQEALPNTNAYVKQYVSHIKGENLHPIGAALNWSLEAATRLITLDQLGNSKLMKLSQELTHVSSIHMMGGLNIGFYAMQLTQIATGGIPEFAALRAQLKSSPAQMGESLSKAYRDVSLLAYGDAFGKDFQFIDTHMKEAYKWAHDVGMFSFSEAELAHQINQSQARKTADKMLTAPIRYGELHTRPAIFMMFVDMLHKEGITGQEGRLVAQNATDFAMANYHPDERPMLYQSLGMVGQMAGALATYKHNYVSQAAARVKQAHKNPAALASALGLGFALYGLGGFPGTQEASQALEWLTGESLREKLLKNPREASGWYDGLLSASTEMDFQSRLSMSSVLPDTPLSTFPHISNFANLIDKAIEFGKQKGSEGSFQDLTLAASGGGQRGYVEKALYSDGRVLDKTSMNKYEQPRSEFEQKMRAVTGIRPFRERLQDERIYVDRKKEAVREKKMADAQAMFDRAYLLNDGRSMDNAFSKYEENGGDPRTLWNSQRLKGVLEKAGMSEEQRRAGKPGNNLNTIRKYEEFTN